MHLLPSATIPANPCYLNNKYTQWYYSIIKNSRNRVVSDTCYTESHHIIPDCFYIINRSKGRYPGWLPGNSNDSNNLVKLTFREHFICHWLLTKMVHPQNVRKMENALQGFRRKSNSQDRILSSVEYARAKTADYNAKKGKTSPRKGIPNLKLRGRPSKRKGISNTALKGKAFPLKWWNNGIDQIRCIDQPEGYTQGRLKGIPNLKNCGRKLGKRLVPRVTAKVICNICLVPIGSGVLKKHQLVCEKSLQETIKVYDKPTPNSISADQLVTWFNKGQILKSSACPGEGWVRVHGSIGLKTWVKDGKSKRSLECPGEGWTLKEVKQVTYTWIKGDLIKRSLRCPGADWTKIEFK